MKEMENNLKIKMIAQEGEGYKLEFKERLSGLDREIVAFANASGGSIFIGIADDGEIKPLEITNSLKSQIQDIAHNCDPSIRINLISYIPEGVLEVQVEEGVDKPYRCRDGFFLRNGPSAQKLRRDEILELLTQKVRFDELLNSKFSYPKDFSNHDFDDFLKLANIQVKAPREEILLSLNAGEFKDGKGDEILLTNAAVLLFAKEPQKFFPESYITCVRYQGPDRFSIADKKDFMGGLISQIESSLDFIARHISVGLVIGEGARHARTAEYPLIALREALINAVAHRDYLYDGSHIYVHMFSDRIEIENPGGLCHGMTEAHLGQRSVRRNRLIADFLHRAGYIERVGSGFSRMEQVLKENNNPELKVSTTNFFNICFYPRVKDASILNLTQRQQRLYQYFCEKNNLTQKEVAVILGVSADTAIRDLKVLVAEKLIRKTGAGRSTIYGRVEI